MIHCRRPGSDPEGSTEQKIMDLDLHSGPGASLLCVPMRDQP